MDQYTMTFADNLKRLRKLAMLTQEELASACGYPSQSRIGNYESSGAARREPALADIPIIARALGVDIAQLWGGEAAAVQSQPMRLDREIVATVARALHEAYEPERLVYNFVDEYELFIQMYEECAAGQLTSTGGAVKVGRWIERNTLQGAIDARVDGVPASGTYKRDKGFQSKA